jgi:hypothetical protein
VLGLALLAPLIACESSGQGATSSPSAATAASAAPSASAASGGPVELPPAKPHIAPDRAAFFLGRKFAFACTFVTFDEPTAAQRNMSEAKRYAESLAVALPPLPPKDKALEATAGLKDAIAKAHGAPVVAAYALGVVLTDTFTTANLGADIGKLMEEIDQQARAAGVAEAVYRDALEALRAKPSADAAKALAQAFERHFMG